MLCVCVLDPSAGLFLWRDPGMKTSSVDLLHSCLCFQTVIYSLMNAQCVCVFCECTFHECLTNSGCAAVGHFRCSVSIHGETGSVPFSSAC